MITRDHSNYLILKSDEIVMRNVPLLSMNSACTFFILEHPGTVLNCSVIPITQPSTPPKILNSYQVSRALTVCMLVVVDLRTYTRKTTECNSGPRFVTTIVCRHYLFVPGFMHIIQALGRRCSQRDNVLGYVGSAVLCFDNYIVNLVNTKVNYAKTLYDIINT